MATTERSNDPGTRIKAKWKNCVILSRSLSSKPFPQWQEVQTSRLEQWGRKTLEHEYHSQESPALAMVLEEDREALQMYNELLDVLVRHFRALKRCPSVHGSVGAGKRVEEKKTSRVRSDRASKSRRSKSATPSYIESPTKRRLSRAASDAEAARSFHAPVNYLGIEQKSAPSIHSAHSALSDATSEFSTQEMDQDMVAESKSMVDEFIQKLYDFTDSLPLDNEPLPETAYRDFLYREIHRTVSKLMPKAKPFMRHRVSRAGSAWLREMAESKDRANGLLAETYYAGKYTHEQSIRRVSSQPNDPTFPSLDWIEHDLRRTHTGEKNVVFPSRHNHLQTSALKGIGDQYESETSEGPVYSQERSSPYDSDNSQRDVAHEKPAASSRRAIYICIDESCPSPYTLFDSHKSWETHVRDMHLLLKTGTWTCKAWCHVSEPGGYPSFHNEDEFRAHMEQDHPTMLNSQKNHQKGDLLKSLAEACYRPAPAKAAQVDCPLCIEDWARDLRLHGKWDETVLLTHVAGHLEEISSQILYLLSMLNSSTKHDLLGTMYG
ncbi:hypothetical protein B0T10DRAFT_97853 [Thelonectria olida]|uniref:Uncharacterized protein n=1 Tax=Thelonectria olida TaxID=1576542 RepID=A0A9P8VY25_9HYPO|nr:hypothetical protein B0T10DRAFT_97853 [Thelonectria olida]